MYLADDLRHGCRVALKVSSAARISRRRELFPPGFGEDLWLVYVVWAVIVVVLYPVCRWFGELKARRREWWLSYL